MNILDHLVWRPVTPDSLPPTRVPVLLKLRVTPVPLVAPGRSAEDVQRLEGRALLTRGTFYGYATAVLVFDLDGFGRQVPQAFALLELDTVLNSMSCSRRVAFDKVEAWAAL